MNLYISADVVSFITLSGRSEVVVLKLKCERLNVLNRIGAPDCDMIILHVSVLKST